MRDKGAGQSNEEDKPCPISQAWKKTELQGQREIPAFPDAKGLSSVSRGCKPSACLQILGAH